MGEFRSDCCEPQHDCCDRPQHCCEQRCDNDGGSIWGILILLFVIYLLFCNNDRGGGLFGGLF